MAWTSMDRELQKNWDSWIDDRQLTWWTSMHTACATTGMDFSFHRFLKVHKSCTHHTDFLLITLQVVCCIALCSWDLSAQQQTFPIPRSFAGKSVALCRIWTSPSLAAVLLWFSHILEWSNHWFFVACFFFLMRLLIFISELLIRMFLQECYRDTANITWWHHASPVLP